VGVGIGAAAAFFFWPMAQKLRSNKDKKKVEIFLMDSGLKRVR
jgi:hypothetical protein